MIKRKLFIIFSNEYEKNTKILLNNAKIANHEKIVGKFILDFYELEFNLKEDCVIKLENNTNNDSIVKDLYHTMNTCICFPNLIKNDLRKLDWIDFSIQNDKFIDIYFKFITLQHKINRFYIENQENFDILSTFIYLIRNIRKNGILLELDQMFIYSKQILSFLFRIAQIDDDKIKEIGISFSFIQHFIDIFLNDLYYSALFGPYTCILYYWNYYICVDKEIEHGNYNRKNYKLNRKFMSFLYSDSSNLNTGYYMKEENFDFISTFCDFGFHEVLMLSYFSFYDQEFCQLIKEKNGQNKKQEKIENEIKINIQDLFIEKLKGYEQNLIDRDPYFSNLFIINEDVCSPFVSFCLKNFPTFNPSLLNLSSVFSDYDTNSEKVNQYLCTICHCISSLLKIKCPPLPLEPKLGQDQVMPFWEKGDEDNETAADSFDQLYLEERGFIRIKRTNKAQETGEPLMPKNFFIISNPKMPKPTTY